MPLDPVVILHTLIMDSTTKKRVTKQEVLQILDDCKEVYENSNFESFYQAYRSLYINGKYVAVEIRVLPDMFNIV